MRGLSRNLKTGVAWRSSRTVKGIVSRGASDTSSQRRIAKVSLLWVLMLSVPALFEVSRMMSAVGVGLLVVAPTLASWKETRRLLVADPIVVMGFPWILAVTLPVLVPSLYKDRMWYELSPEILDYAALWMYRSWAASNVAYWLGRVLIRERTPRPATMFDYRVQVLMRRWIGVLGVLGAVAYIVFTGGYTHSILEETAVQDSTAKQILLLFMELSYAYVFLYFHARGRESLQALDRHILLAVLGVQGIIFITSGSKYTAMILAAAWLLGNATAMRRSGFLKEVGWVAAGIGAIFAISYMTAAYRGELVSRPLPLENAPVTQVLAFHFDVIISAIETILEGGDIGKGYYTNYDAKYIFDRFGHLSSLAFFWDEVGLDPPYENAISSLLAPVYAFVPRSLFPSKPHYFGSGDFARYIGWEYGGVSITTPGSFFWAWGYVGIIVGMAGIGLAFAWLWMRSIGDDTTALIRRTVMTGALLKLLDVGVTFQMVLVPVTRNLALLLFLRWLIRLQLTNGRNRGN